VVGFKQVADQVAVPWVVDQVMVDRAYPGLNLAGALQQLGVPYQLGSWALNGGLTLPGPVPASFVAYGSHEFCKALQRQHSGGLYFGLTSRMDYLTYVSELPDIEFLNSPAVATSWQQLRANPQFWQSVMGGTGLFTRPNANAKTFTGQCLPYAQWEDRCAGLDQTSSVMPTTTVIVAPQQQILGEFRFVVAGSVVVAGSEYSWAGRLDVRQDWPPECYALAARVAERGCGWTPDSVYVVDVALTPSGPRVVELNSFCCAGLYACNTLAVVRAVGAQALKETTA
jgi:hypothetical protein